MIPFLPLAKILEAYQGELEEAALRVMRSGYFVLGPELEAFEHEWAAFCGTKACIGVGNALDAMRLCLSAWDFEPGAEVLVPSNTLIATWLGILQAGLKPIPVEPDPQTHIVEAKAYEARLTANTVAILPVHLYGQACNGPELLQLAKRYKLRILEDAAQGHGAEFDGIRSGALGHAAAFSFYPTKNLGGLGDGGALTTNDTELARRVRALRNYGEEGKYHNVLLGANSRLDELQAALLRVRLRYLDAENRHRTDLAHKYLRQIHNPHIILPHLADKATSSWHLFVVRSTQRAKLQQHLESKGIGSAIHYPTPPHQQPALATLAAQEHWDCPTAVQLSNEVLSLPLHPALSDDDAQRVIDAVNSFRP